MSTAPSKEDQSNGQGGQVEERDWVTTLPAFDGIVPNQTASSLVSRFSLFNLFRSSPATPSSTLLDPLHSLVPSETPSEGEFIRAIGGLAEYIRHVINSSSTLSEGELRERIGNAADGYVVAINVGVRAVVESGYGDYEVDEKIPALVTHALEGLFIIHKYQPRDGVTREILSSIFEPTALSNRLCPLFVHARQVVDTLRGATRASSVKSSGIPAAEQAEQLEHCVMALCTWLEVYARHIRDLGGLPAFPEMNMPKGKEQGRGGREKRKTKADLKREEQERAGRPVSIALEAELLKADLQMTMASARIEDVKRRALDMLGGGKEEGTERERGRSASTAPSLVNRKRRALTDESDLDLEVDNDNDMVESISPEPERGSSTQVESHANETKWDELAEATLLGCISVARSLVVAHRSNLLTDNLTRPDWLDDGARPLLNVRISSPVRATLQPIHSPASPVKRMSTKVTKNNSTDLDSESDTDADLDSDSDSDSTISSSSHETEEEDLSYACPLRTIFRLYDRFEEQRLAVWLGLPPTSRPKMGLYTRGEGGKVGSAWDALGLGLLIDYDSDTLEAFGLSPEKHDKWVELASRRNAKKIRKRGRKTM